MPHRQPKLPNRKRPEFVRCPVCDTEFCRRNPGHTWCSPECSDRTKRRAGDAPRRGGGADAMVRDTGK